ncbi:MAG: hypothetical protein RPU63_01820 [Candidatus Sedimenticola sp. (ex Thyasira tokunagai)]
MIHTHKTLVPLVAILLLLVGCKSLPALTQGDDERSLQDTLRNYEATVRWGYPGQAYNFLHEDLAKKTQPPESLNNIRVTGYKVIRAPGKAADGTVNQIAVIGYIFIDRQVEHSLTDKQHWEYDKENDSWSRINPIPEFK